MYMELNIAEKVDSLPMARELLAPVYGWFTEGFDTRDLKGGKALLDTLLACERISKRPLQGGWCVFPRWLAEMGLPIATRLGGLAKGNAAQPRHAERPQCRAHSHSAPWRPFDRDQC
jgi:hypothetical protein